MTPIRYEYYNEKIVITIQSDFLAFVAENNPDYKLKITDKEAFSKAVLFELENNLGQSGSGLTGFQELIDKAIEAVAEDGNDFVMIEYNSGKL